VADTWNGKRLTDAQPVADDQIHYRIHAVDDGALLGFGSPGGGALQAAVRHFLDVQAEHPGRRIVIRQYDREAREEDRG
jgi:ABC-type sugar transport system substrate-binding protein